MDPNQITWSNAVGYVGWLVFNDAPTLVGHQRQAVLVKRDLDGKRKGGNV